MIKESEQGYYFISENNKRYDLYQGYCIKSATGRWRNDICYIHNEDGKLIGWFYGAEIFSKKKLESYIKFYVKCYEDEQE